ncbi:hypothetical protein Tco_1384596 [Tanacetum coccineum]
MQLLSRFLKVPMRAIRWKNLRYQGLLTRVFVLTKITYGRGLRFYSSESTVGVKPEDPRRHQKEVEKLLEARLIYPISDSPWVSPVHCVPKKGGITVVKNDDNDLIPTRLVTGWRVCIDYRKLNEATRKDHFPLPFMGIKCSKGLAGKGYPLTIVSSMALSGYFQISIDPNGSCFGQTFTCP